MRLAAYYFKNQSQVEMMYFNSFVYGKNLSWGTVSIHSVLTGTQFLLAADMQDLVVRALSSKFVNMVYFTTKSPNKSNNWLRSYLIKLTKFMSQDENTNLLAT